MPLVRFKIRNELSLAKPELNRSAAVEYEEPKAILGAVEVAGLVGILRQLGDLAEFSAEVFNGIQEEVTVTASRCQKLTSRVKRIESALSPLEKAVLSQTSHIHFAYTAGCEWHPRIRNGHGHFVQSDLPLCVMESYEQCRDPPPLHRLDRFDVNGPGSCLRKYSDPTFFRKNLSNNSKADDVQVQKDKAHRKKKKRRLPERNICRSHAVSTSEETNGTHISSLTDDKQTASGSASTVDMPRSSNLQELSDIVDQSHLQEHIEAQIQSDFRDSSKPRDSITGSGYIEYVINQSPVDEPEVKLLQGFLTGSLQPGAKRGSAVPESRVEVVDDNIVYDSSEDLHVPYASTVCDEKKSTLESRFEKISKDEEASEIHESKFGPGTPDMIRQDQRDFDRSYILFDEVDIVEEKQSKIQANIIDETLGAENVGETSEQGSESDEFVDARNTIESESESEHDGTPKPNLEHYFGDISTYCSEDANSDNNDGSEDIAYETMAEDSYHDDSLDESSSGSHFGEDANISCFLSDPVSGKGMSLDDTFQKPKEVIAISPSLLVEETAPDKTILREESVATNLSLVGDCADEKISFEEPISPCPSLEDAMPTEKILPERHFTKYSFFTEVVPQEKILAKDPYHVDTLDESCSGSYFREDANVSCVLSDPVSGKAMSRDDTFQKPKEVVAISPSSLAEDTDPDKTILREESVAAHPSLVGDCADEKISFEEPISPCPSLEDAVPTEKNLPEGHFSNYSFFTEAVPKEKILAEDPFHVDSLDEFCSGSYFQENKNVSCVLSDPVSGKAMSHDATSQNPKEFVAMSPLLLAEELVPDKIVLQEEPVATHPLLAGDCADKKISSEEPISPCQSLEDAKTLPEGHLSNYSFFTEVIPQEEILPEESVAKYQSLAEVNEMLPPKPLPEILSLAEAAPDSMMTPAEEPDVAHPSFSKAVQDEKISPEVPDFKVSPDVSEAVLQEQDLLKESVPNVSLLTEEPDYICLSSTRAMTIENVVPEKPLGTNNCLAESRKENSLQEISDDSPPPSYVKVAPEENISAEVLESTKFSAAEAVPEEQISLEEVAGIDQCLAEVVPGEMFLPEDPVTTCMPLERVGAVEKVLPEGTLETFSSLAELPEDSISDEEADDATHPLFYQAVNDKIISPEVLDSSYNVAEAVPREPISLDEVVGIDPCLEETVHDERCLREEPMPTSIEKVLPEELLETYPSLEKLQEERISHEEADSHPHEEVFDYTHLSQEEAIIQEKILPEEFVGVNPCLVEAVPDERGLPEKSVTTSMSLTEVVPIENVLREEPLEASASLEILPNEKLSQEQSDDATDLSWAKAVDDEKVSSENLASTNLSVAEAFPQEQIALEEFVGIDPCLTEAVSDERLLPEEPVTTCLSNAPIENSLPEEPLEELAEENILREEEPHGAANPSFSEAVGDENISLLDGLGSTYPSLEESMHERLSNEELVGTKPFLDTAIPEERIFQDESGVIYQSKTEDDSKEKSVPEEPLPTYPSLGEAVPDEKISKEEPDEILAPDEEISEEESDENISVEEPDATCSASAEVIFDEEIPSLETFGSTTETGPHNKIFPEEPVATDLSLAEVVSDEEIPGSESPHSTTENGQYNETFPEELVATDLPLVQNVFDEKIVDAEAPDSTREPGSHDKTFPEERVVTELSLTEPVPDGIIPSKEPAAAYLSLAEGIPDQQVFLDDAAFLSFAEAIFAEKFTPEVPDPAYPSSTEPEMPVAPPSLDTASDVSTDKKSGQLSGSTVLVSPDTQDSQSNGTSVEPVSIWSNGGLFGLAPLKPPVFAAPSSVSEHTQNQINEASVLATRKQKSSDRLVEDSTEKCALPLVVSDPTSQQHSKIGSHSNGSHSLLPSTPTSLKVFGLSQKLLMAGFRGNSSSTCKFEAIPGTSYDTQVAAIEDKTQQTLGGLSFEEQLDYQSSLFGSPTASPPVEHMKISFNTKNLSSVSKLNLRIPSQSQHNGEFPSFQLVPETSNSDDEDSDIFCHSSPCVSDNCLSDSELWESDESPRKSVSSLHHEAGEKSRHGELGSFSGSFLDLPCFDSVDHHQSTSSRKERGQEQEQDPRYKPSVSEIIRAWPPNPKAGSSNEANTLLQNTQNQSAGLAATDDDDGER